MILFMLSNFLSQCNAVKGNVTLFPICYSVDCSFSPQSVFVKYYRAVATNICEICLFFSYSLSTCMVALQ